jgi:hypothetical protein
VVGAATVATIVEFTPVERFFEESARPADGVWVLVGCVVGLAALLWSAPDPAHRPVLAAVAGGFALYAMSLGILGLAEWASTASVETDFERGHTAVSGLWALVGLALLVIGLLRGSALVRYSGLALFGLSLAKIFLYDLASLSSVARAFSFILARRPPARGRLLPAAAQRHARRRACPRHRASSGYAASGQAIDAGGLSPGEAALRPVARPPCRGDVPSSSLQRGRFERASGSRPARMARQSSQYATGQCSSRDRRYANARARLACAHVWRTLGCGGRMRRGVRDGSRRSSCISTRAIARRLTYTSTISIFWTP